VKVLDDRFYIIRAGDTEEMQATGAIAGCEILQIDGIPVKQVFHDKVLRYHTRGSKRADEAVGVFYLLYGPEGTNVRLTVRGRDQGIREVDLTRNATTGKHSPFMYTFITHLMANTVEHSWVSDSILYVNLPNLESSNPGIRDDFLALIDTANLARIKGMIIDLRYNMGGSHNILHPIVSSLIDAPVQTPLDHYVEYAPALARWEKRDAFSVKTRNWEVQPRDGKRYLGPLVLLIGPTTHSSGEDMAIELSQTGRCMTIGARTAGGAGGRYAFPLPGGGEFSVSTFKATYPSGKEYMATGILPDIEIHQTLDDILEGKDREVEKGIEVVKNWESIFSEQGVRSTVPPAR
jgi:C-terminal processing protease CtpA/Prc